MLRRNLVALILLVCAGVPLTSIGQVPTEKQTIARANALSQSGSRLKSEGKWEDAAKDYSSALALYRSVRANDASYAPIMASLLHNLGYLHLKQKRAEDARNFYEEALWMYRTIAKKDATYLPKVPKLLISLSKLSRNEKGGAEKAARYAEEALAINRALAGKNPSLYLPEVADNLEELGAGYRDQHRFVDAYAVLHEAIDIYRGLPLDNSQQFVELAKKLNYVAIRLAEAGYTEEARKAYGDSIAVCRFLEAKNKGSDAASTQKAQSLVNLGSSFSLEGRHAETRKAFEEALDIHVALARKNPKLYLGGAMDNLHTMIVMSRNSDSWDELAKRYAHAASILEPLDAENRYGKERAWIRRNLSSGTLVY